MTPGSWLTSKVMSCDALEVVEEVENAGLDRDVERRGRLVEQQQFWFQQQGAGDGDALALAARELVRIAVGDRRGQTDRARAPRRPRVIDVALADDASAARRGCGGCGGGGAATA